MPANSGQGASESYYCLCETRQWWESEATIDQEANRCIHSAMHESKAFVESKCQTFNASSFKPVHDEDTLTLTKTPNIGRTRPNAHKPAPFRSACTYPTASPDSSQRYHSERFHSPYPRPRLPSPIGRLPRHPSGHQPAICACLLPRTCPTAAHRL